MDDPQAFIKYCKKEKLVDESFSASSRYRADAAVTKTLGFNPNFYDYRIAKLSCTGCYSYTYHAMGAWLLRADVNEALNVCKVSVSGSIISLLRLHCTWGSQRI